MNKIDYPADSYFGMIQPFTEASLSRILSQTKNPFAIITAFRGQLSKNDLKQFKGKRDALRKANRSRSSSILA